MRKGKSSLLPDDKMAFLALVFLYSVASEQIWLNTWYRRFLPPAARLPQLGDCGSGENVRGGLSSLH